MTYSKPTATRQRLTGLMVMPSMCRDEKYWDSDACAPWVS